jgi:hypothetical protein
LKLIWGLVAAGLAASFLFDLLTDASRPAFYAAYGFVGCIVIIIGSKWVGRLLQRDEDYYDEGGSDG